MRFFGTVENDTFVIEPNFSTDRHLRSDSIHDHGDGDMINLSQLEGVTADDVSFTRVGDRVAIMIDANPNGTAGDILIRIVGGASEFGMEDLIFGLA